MCSETIRNFDLKKFLKKWNAINVGDSKNYY